MVEDLADAGDAVEGADLLAATDASGAVETEAVTVSAVAGAQARVVDGLLTYYDFATGAGARVFDVAEGGDALDLTIADVDRVTWLDCGGLRLDAPTVLTGDTGTQQIVTAVKHSHEITLELWVSPHAQQPGSQGTLFQLATDVRQNNRLLDLVRVEDRYRVRYRSKASGRESVLYSPAGSVASAGPAGEGPTHIVFTREHAQHRGHLYLNGERVASAKMTGALFAKQQPYTLQLGEGQGLPWLGRFLFGGRLRARLVGGGSAAEFPRGPAGRGGAAGIRGGRSGVR